MSMRPVNRVSGAAAALRAGFCRSEPGTPVPKRVARSGELISWQGRRTRGGLWMLFRGPVGIGAFIALLVPAVGLTPAAWAVGPPAVQGGCATIASDRERLACYDRLHGGPVTVVRDLPAARPAMGDLALAPAHPTSSEPMNATPAPAPAVSSESPRSVSLLGSAWSLDPDSPRYVIDLYRPNYILPVRWSSRPNEDPFDTLFEQTQEDDTDLNDIEARFQLSFKARVLTDDDRRWGLWFAYTQQSQWQVYNGDLSRPFRETNYEPELFGTFRPDVSFAGFNWRLFALGYNHQSNGRADPISRSWDRLIAQFGIERDNLALHMRAWYRLDDDDADDDNPDITDYYGYGDITGVYKWGDHSFALMVRGNPSTEKGAAQFTWMTPPLVGPLRGYLQVFTGYGDSMIDYDWRQNAIGAGIALNDLLDKR
jgi:phospholipase A1/A2